MLEGGRHSSVEDDSDHRPAGGPAGSRRDEATRMTHPPKLDDLLRDPSRYYANPNAVIDDDRLSPAQKLEVLKA
ncbi:MAG: hypothetical protein AB7G39_11225 [Alphaproteobacteria bacterium]